MTIPISLPQTTGDGRARNAALQAALHHTAEPTSAVSYNAQNSVLIVGDGERALAAAAQLGEQMNCTVVPSPGASHAHENESTGKKTFYGVNVVSVAMKALSGHLGQFVATVLSTKGELNLAKQISPHRDAFDMVLDLNVPPLLDHEVLPPGYYAPGSDSTALENALSEIPEMVGEFEKPKFFNYNPSICAHGNSGLTGCTKCLEACPTQAIRSMGDSIEVNPYLCQGAGSCTTACPTGAITYAYPKASDLLSSIKRTLRVYRDYQGSHPLLLFHDRESGQSEIEHQASELPENVIPIQVEEVGSVGMDIWLASLAYGASQVVLLTTDAVSLSVLKTVEVQHTVATALLNGMGLDPRRIHVLHAGSMLIESLKSLPIHSELPAASFTALDEKRNTQRFALDHLYQCSPRTAEVAPLPVGAAFGEIIVNKKACTVCMSCVSICPSSALIDGKDTPRLSFLEWNCVQCGLCRNACPEDAISLNPRMLYQQDMRMRPRVLNEEEPFCCVACGKPFATKSMMERMAEKLKGHWMYQDERSRRRLQMCEDCRVKDLYKQEDIHYVDFKQKT